MFYNLSGSDKKAAHKSKQVRQARSKSTTPKRVKAAKPSKPKDFRSLICAKATRVQKEQAIAIWNSKATIKDIRNKEIVYSHIISLPFDHESIGMHKDAFACASVSCEQVATELQLFVSAFLPNPFKIIDHVFSNRTDAEMLTAARSLIVALHHVHVVSPKGHLVVSLMAAFLASKRCPSCKALNLECDRCAWSHTVDMQPDSLAQRLLSVLPQAPLDCFAFKNEVASAFSQGYIFV